MQSNSMLCCVAGMITVKYKVPNGNAAGAIEEVYRHHTRVWQAHRQRGNHGDHYHRAPLPEVQPVHSQNSVPRIQETEVRQKFTIA